MALNATDDSGDRWKSLAYLLQESRFRVANAWADRMVAWQLVSAEPEWSLKYSSRALEQEPDSAYGQYLLAAGYYNVKHFDDAEKHYLIALEDDNQRRASLKELSTMWLYDSGLAPKTRAAKAKPYIDRLIREYPEYGLAWFMRISQSAMATGIVDEATVQSFLKHADRKDPRQAKAAASIESARRSPAGK